MTSHALFAAPLLLVIAGCASTSPLPPPARLSGFAAPESVLYDPKGDQYFVSNIQGDPFAVDHDGFISRVAPDGTMIALRFIDGRGVPDGLSAPKGTALVGRTLYVADIDRIRLYDADTGASRGAMAIPGATFLNDVDAAPDGTVYVTDSAVRREGTRFVPHGTEAVYALREGEPPRQIARGDLGSPNGIAWNDGKLEIVTLVSGEWITLSLSGDILQRSTLPTGMLDGVVKRETGELLVSSWNGPAIYSVRAGAAAKTLFANTLGADIGYDPKRARLLLPNMTENTVSFVPIPR